MKHAQIMIFLLAGILISCEQSDPAPFGRTGDKVLFSGLEWNVKTSTTVVGPGPNLFSPFPEDVFVDDNGYLHMRIAEHDGQWYSSEVVSEDTMGFGTYTFTIEGDFVSMPENVVVGLFTWDNNTFFTQANSEVDVELSKWGDASKTNTLQYAVQPVAFSDFFAERVFNPENTSQDLVGVSTHSFTWTDTLISFMSFRGESTLIDDMIAQWEFDLDNPARVKEEGGQSSEPIVIPHPGNTTNARINFWLLPWVAPAPTDGNDQEYIVRSFSFEPS